MGLEPEKTGDAAQTLKAILRRAFKDALLEILATRGMTEEELRGVSAILGLAQAMSPEDVRIARTIVEAGKADVPIQVTQNGDEVSFGFEPH
jgi:hypothetical protein